MKLNTHFIIDGYKSLNNEESVFLSVEEIVELAVRMNEGDIIYTYPPKYMSLGGRVALHGSKNGNVYLDVQHTSCAFVGEVESQNLAEYLNDCENLIKKPEIFGLVYEE